MNVYKKEINGSLEIGRVYYNKRFSLTVDRKLCKGCVLCKLACPKGAISLVPQGFGADGEALAPLLDVDENKCDFHGICAVVCPFSAIKIAVNGKEEIAAVNKDVFPTLTRDVEIDAARCAQGCKECAKKCPLDVFKAEAGVVEVAKRELCAGCQICWDVCPTDAVSVTKFIEGSIKINQGMCPKSCQNCLDVCPVNALYIEGGRVYVNNNNCIYCGACQTVCPDEDAIELERTAIRHSPIESGAWNKGLEKLTSTAGLNKELAASRADKARAAVNNLKEGK